MANPKDWAATLQEVIEEIRANHAKWATAAPGLVQAIQGIRESTDRGFGVILDELRERHDADRREERQRIVHELTQLYDTCRSIRHDLAANATDARNRIVESVAASLAEPFADVEHLAQEALRAVGITVRDEDEPFDARFDVVAGTTAVTDRSAHRMPVRVEAPGYVWADGGVYRPRHVVIGLYPEPTKPTQEVRHAPEDRARD